MYIICVVGAVSISWCRRQRRSNCSHRFNTGASNEKVNWKETSHLILRLAKNGHVRIRIYMRLNKTRGNKYEESEFLDILELILRRVDVFLFYSICTWRFVVKSKTITTDIGGSSDGREVSLHPARLIRPWLYAFHESKIQF